MNQVKANGFTKQMARNMFYGGSVFFIFVFGARQTFVGNAQLHWLPHLAG